MASGQDQNQPLLDYSNAGPGILVGCYILAFIATVSVALRFWARKLTSLRPELDDYLVLSALIAHHGVAGAATVQVLIGGVGRDMRIVSQDPSAVVTLFKMFFVSEIFYGFSSSLVKLGLLVFYCRVFPTKALIDTMPTAQGLLVSRTSAAPGNDLLGHNIIFSGQFDSKLYRGPLYFGTADTRNIETADVKVEEDWDIRYISSWWQTGPNFKHTLTPSEQFVTPGAATAVEIYAAITGACLPTLKPVYRKLRYGDPYCSSKSTPVDGIITIGRIPNKQKDNIGDEETYERLDTDGESTPAFYRSTSQVHVINQGGRPSSPTHSTVIPLEKVIVEKDITWPANTKCVGSVVDSDTTG
ncbi:hypothetical protein F5Y13DRAFT_204510 [Hypoxylon sp. FL1857]|nr:hypothetical protein F5Y13DRAFT_204510 [Hypoxylon sp. FL1857]